MRQVKDYFLKRQVFSINDLEEKKTIGYEICKGMNEESTLCSDTTVAIIGSFIPKHLYYFYSENCYVYEAIESSRHCGILKYKTKKNASLSENLKSEYKKQVKKILKQEKIAFLDLAEAVLVKDGKSGDNDIRNILISKRIDELKKLKQKNKNLAIITISKNVQDYLNSINVENCYVKLFPGKSNEFPKGTDFKKLWKSVFDIPIYEDYIEKQRKSK